MYYANRYRTRTLADPPGGRCPLVYNYKGVVRLYYPKYPRT